MLLFLSSLITPFLYAKTRMPSIPALKESGGKFRKGEHSEFILTLAKEGRRVPRGLTSPGLHSLEPSLLACRQARRHAVLCSRSARGRQGGQYCSLCDI